MFVALLFAIIEVAIMFFASQVMDTICHDSKKTWRRARLAVTALAEDGSAVAAIEFAMLVPIMLVLFFGTVIFSSGVAVDRKVTLMARTFSDLVSQNTSVSSTRRRHRDHDAVRFDADHRDHH